MTQPNDVFKEVLETLLYTFWPKDNYNQPIDPTELDGAQLIKFREQIDLIRTAIPSDWSALGQWFNSLAEEWQTWATTGYAPIPRTQMFQTVEQQAEQTIADDPEQKAVLKQLSKIESDARA